VPLPLSEKTRGAAGAFPAEMKLGFLRDRRFRVRQPIAVRFALHEGQCVAEAAEFGEFGYGASAGEALADLQGALAQLYFALKEDSDRLGRDLQQVWHRLNKAIGLDEY